jgi:hypothetical protein
MTDGSDIYFPPNRKNRNKNSDENTIETNKDQNKNESEKKEGEDENENEYNVEYAGSNETNELLYPVFINEAAYNEKDIAFLLLSKMEFDLQIIVV